MVKLTDEIKESLTGTKISVPGNSFEEGAPNVVPIGAFSFWMTKGFLFRTSFSTRR